MNHQEHAVAEVAPEVAVKDAAAGLKSLLSSLGGAGNFGDMLEQMRLSKMPKLTTAEAEVKIDEITDRVLAELAKGAEIIPADFPTADAAIVYFARGHIAAYISSLDMDEVIERLDAPIDVTTIEACKLAMRNEFVREALFTTIDDDTVAFDTERVESVIKHVSDFWPHYKNSVDKAAAEKAAEENAEPVVIHPEQIATKQRVGALLNTLIKRIMTSGLGTSPNEVLSEFSGRLLSQRLVEFMADKEMSTKEIAPFLRDLNPPRSSEELVQQYVEMFVLPVVVKIDKTEPVAEQQPWEYIEAGEAEVYTKLDLILAK